MPVGEGGGEHGGRKNRETVKASSKHGFFKAWLKLTGKIRIPHLLKICPPRHLLEKRSL